MGLFNFEFNGGGLSGINGMELIEDIFEMFDFKQDVEIYKQVFCVI